MKPNILLITSDQQRTDSLSCYGSRWMQTPGLEKLATQGVLFDRAYCTNPVCMPSRVSLFSGRLMSKHGVWNVGVNAAEEDRFLSHHLSAAGYATAYVGKAHFQSYGGSHEESCESIAGWGNGLARTPLPYYGFDSVDLALGHSLWGMSGHYGDWLQSQLSAPDFAAYRASERRSDTDFGGEAYDWSLPTRFHNSVWTADRTMDFLHKHDTNRPFFLSVGFQDPHMPHALPLDFENRVDPASVPLPDYDEGELDDKPPHFGWAHRGELESSPIRGDYHVAGQGAGADFRRVSERDAQLGRAYYYGMVQLMDAQIGRILDALEERGLADNTIVVFTTDHGELLGDHGLWMKGPFHYEQLIRVPLIIRWPGVFPRGARTSALWSHLDLVPTMLEAAGLPIPHDLDGVSAVNVLTGTHTKVRDSVLVECVDDPRGLRLKTVVTEDRKLTWYCGHSYGELYDLAKDPREKVNLWNEPAYAADKAALLSRLLTALEGIEKRLPRHCYA